MSERDYPTYAEIQAAQRQLAANYNCNWDHCTPEERAVIEAVVEDRLGILDEGSAGPDALNRMADRAITARNKLNQAVTQLLAVRFNYRCSYCGARHPNHNCAIPAIDDTDANG